MRKWLVVLLIVTVAAGTLFAGAPGQPKMKDHHPIWLRIISTRPVQWKI